MPRRRATSRGHRAPQRHIQSNADKDSKLKAEIVSRLHDSQPLASILLSLPSRFLARKVHRPRLCSFLVKLVVALIPLALGPTLPFLTSDLHAEWLLLLFIISLATLCSLIGLEDAVEGWARGAEPIVNLLTEERDLLRFDSWVQWAFDPIKQAAAALTCAFCFLATVAVAAWVGSFNMPLSVYAGALLPALVIGNGFYWGIITPRGITTICKCAAMKVYVNDPVNTPGIVRLSSIAGAHSRIGAVMVVVASVAFLYVGLQGPSNAFMATLAIWFLLGLANELYVFFYPHYHLYTVVSREKLRLLLRIQGMIEAMYPEMELMGKETVTAMVDAVTLYDSLKSTSASRLRFRDWFQHISSAATPVLLVILAELPDWQSIRTVLLH